MQRLFSAFPVGWPGLGLLLLRVVASIVLIGQEALRLANMSDTIAAAQPSMVGPHAWSVILIIGGLLLGFGLWTPVVGAMLAISHLSMAWPRLMAGEASGIAQGGGLALLLMASITAALVLLGPGAFSLDARRFGRRRITIR